MFDRRFGKGAAPEQTFHLEWKKIPLDLIFALRVYHAIVGEYHEMNSALKDEPISERNEREVWESLGTLSLETLQRYPTTFKHDTDLLKEFKRGAKSETQPTRNFKNAVMYRRSEKRILTHVVEVVDEHLEALHDSHRVRKTDFLTRSAEDENKFVVV